MAKENLTARNSRQWCGN